MAKAGIPSMHPWEPTRRCALIAFAWMAATFLTLAVEPWADEKLPVKDGLELWLDASSENGTRTRTQSQLPSVPHGAPLDVWHDGSGNKRDVSQLIPGARPRLFQSAHGAVVRFDGLDDFLVANRQHDFTNLTILIQAAPRSNKGGFRAFLGASRPGLNDYTGGINVDLGFTGTPRFEVLNVEGTGFSGMRNLLKTQLPFEQMLLLTVVVETNRVKLWLNGAAQAERERAPGSMAADVISIGARFYSNTGEPPHVQGFFDGDIANVLIYGRALAEQERARVEHFLSNRSFATRAPGRKFATLEMVTNDSPVRMFLPGFESKELTVHLNNLNCIKYREDGKLVALGYDGTIWLLTDTDADGLEDKAVPFWNKPTLRAPIGMALTPTSYSRGQGVFLPSKGKLSLIVDTNRDDVADEEIVIADGWKELSHGVDALGVAVAPDGTIYFGLGTANFTDAYLLDGKTHEARYSLNSERGTILKVLPDFSRREIFCTGIRFPVALAFNSTGDLFCTDQEGATWLPNGNPFDELLHLQPGRHYGFPPRHPKHLPNVVDEPSVFDYTPQHQSTCGLNFNLPVNGGPIFGPDSWRGDAFVAGYSRGKLYRTRLVRTAVGYVAQTHLLGAVQSLLVDACVSPRGELVLSTQSGAPDWGSGPTGVGNLYKVSYAHKDAAQLVGLWPASPTEIILEFDRALDVTYLKNLHNKITVTQGRYVGAGDRFEILRPGYQVVQNQLAEPRLELELYSVAVSANGNQLALRTTPRVSAFNYAITLPSVKKTSPPDTNGPGDETIEIAHDLSGVEALWESSSGKGNFTIWLPHLDLNVSRQFTADSPSHKEFWAALLQPGKLILRTQFDPWQMLHPAIQPGSQLDYVYPTETISLSLTSSAPFQASVTPEADAEKLNLAQPNAHEVRLTTRLETNRWIPLHIVLTLDGSCEPTLEASWSTAEDERPRALPLRRLLVPWARPTEGPMPAPTERAIPQLAGGQWVKGRRIFFDDRVGCAKCHTINGAGGQAGPDLSNLVHRDYDSVLKDILQPSVAINPDHVAYNLQFKGSQELLSGIPVGGDADKLLLADSTGRVAPITRATIASMKPSSISLMPEGLLNGLSQPERKDLLTFLLMPEPLQPAQIEIPGAPPPRARAQIEGLFAASTNDTNSEPQPLMIVLCAGPKDHGPGEHDYPLWQQRWSNLLALAENVSVETAWEWPTPEQFDKANALVFYSDNPGWSPARGQQLDSFLKRGGGLVYIHYAVDGHAHCEELAQRIGLAWRGGASAFRHGPLNLRFEKHGITKGFSALELVDESYWNLVGNENDIQLLASGVENEKSRPLIWVRERDRGRIFVSIPGHYTWTFDDPLFRLLLLRGIAWTAHQPVDRFKDLATIGSRMSPHRDSASVP